MPESNQVVVHFNSGGILKGNTHDFNPRRGVFHVEPTEGGASIAAHLRDIKALFFVRDFSGNPTRESLRGFVNAPGETAHGKKVAVLFNDGELICGYTLGYVPGRQGFFVRPSDPNSNNLRIYVLEASAKVVQAGPAAEALVESVLLPHRV